MGPRKQEVCVESACHVRWDFTVEVYHLSAGGEIEDQGCIAAGGGWCHFTTSSWFGINKDFTGCDTGGDHVASFDAEQVEEIDVEIFAAIGTKIKLQKWVKKYESQVSDRDKLKLKVVILHDSISKEVLMTQPIRFATENLVTVAWARWARLNELRMAWSFGQDT